MSPLFFVLFILLDPILVILFLFFNFTIEYNIKIYLKHIICLFLPTWFSCSDCPLPFLNWNGRHRWSQRNISSVALQSWKHIHSWLSIEFDHSKRWIHSSKHIQRPSLSQYLREYDEVDSCWWVRVSCYLQWLGSLPPDWWGCRYWGNQQYRSTELKEHPQYWILWVALSIEFDLESNLYLFWRDFDSN